MYYAIIIIAIAAILALSYLSPMFSMHPLATGKIAGTDIIAIRNRINNVFFIPSGEDWIVIDAGSVADMVKQEMERLSIKGDKVKGVFLTHTDYDHVASLPLFPNAVIYMSALEKQMIDGSTRRQFLKKNSLPGLSDSNKITYLSDNESVTIGNRKVHILWAPGHTKGSAMYGVDEKYLFTGDAFRVSNGDILVHPYTMDRKQAKKSIDSFKDERKKYEKVFTAHYGWF